MSAAEAPGGQSVTYGYDPVTGRKVTETDAAGKITRYAYNSRDQVTHVWGDVPVPVRYEYDAYGRLRKLHTFRADAGFTGVQWPADAGTGDVTEWVYDAATGLLSSKIYADGKGVTYTYLSGARLHTRTWARTADGAAIVTAYGYDTATGELTDIDYSGSTPDIHFTYDRAGRKKTVTDALGTRTFTYDGLLPDTEVLSGLYERTIDYDYETSADGVPGRLSGFSTGPDYQAAYAYEHGRISGVNWETGGQSGSVSYGYENGLTGSILFSNGPTVTNTYDPAERWLTQVKNENTSGTVSQYTYIHGSLGRRETVTYSGAAFGNSSYRRFAYDDRSQVTSSSAFAGSDITDTSAPLPPEHRSYQYDPIGNRTAAAGWNDTENISETAAYTSNALNQYTEIAAAHTDIPEYDDDGNLLKLSADGPVMTYDGENRLSAVEYEGLLGDVNGDGSVNLADAVTSLQVAAGMTPPDVTAVGDVSSDGKIGVEEAVHALQVSAGLKAAAAAARKLVFAYDYTGRRVKKAVYADERLLSETLFVWNGWNLIEEITRVNGTESSRYFVWGLDLSQSLQGAGGIGGLLCMSDATASYHYLYDANGNVTQLVNAATGEISAHYEYDPFGNLTAKSGAYADANPFRFSTKYFDGDTGLYYYGFRDYLPELGRWTSRDPIWEDGGLNIYGFVGNDGINSVDQYGLAKCKVKKFSLEAVKWNIKFPEKDFFIFSTDRYTIALEVKFNLEIDNCCDKNDCDIVQYKTGKSIFGRGIGIMSPRGYEYGREPAIFNHAMDGNGWTGGQDSGIITSISWLGLSWNIFGRTATFADAPGFYNLSADDFPLYRGSEAGNGYFVFNTEVHDHKTGELVSGLEWKMLIDYKSPTNGRHESDPKVGERLIAK